MDILTHCAAALGALVIILLGCELFTNGVEWLGCKLSLGAGAVGSVLAAVGTALPETAVPLVAILILGGEAGREIGVGAILGAPFMLATLAFNITAVAVVYHALRGRRGYRMDIDAQVVGQDLSYFFVVYAVAILASFIPWHGVKIGVAIGLLGCYAYYVWLHFRKKSAQEEQELRQLHFCHWREGDPWMWHIIVQIVVSLAAILAGAHVFVNALEHLGGYVGISARVLSMIVTPIATELPEKFNSVIWVGRRKDTLAMGNITGAMVFQSCVPVAVGLIGTAWVLDTTSWTSAVIALVSAATIYTVLRWKRHLDGRILFLGLPLYIVFIVVALRSSG